jgi:hypothetical protein
MALKEYKPGTSFPGPHGHGPSASPSPAWPAPLRAKDGAPNVLFMVLDDTGFGRELGRTAQGREKFSYRRATNSSTLRPDARMRARSVPGASSRC